MHGDEDTGLHFDECSDGFFRVHVDVPAAGGIVGTDGHEGDVGGVVFANFFEAVEIGAVTAVENFAGAGGDDVTAVVAVGIVDVACAPVVARGVDDGEVSELEGIPDGHFVYGVEAEFLNEFSAAAGDDDAFV